MSEEEIPREERMEVERFRLVGRRLPDEMKNAIRELGNEMPIDFVEVDDGEEDGPELSIETRCGSTKITEMADKARLLNEMTLISCETEKARQMEKAIEEEKEETIPEEEE